MKNKTKITSQFYNVDIPVGWQLHKLENILIEGRLGGNYENAESNIGIPVIKMGNLDRGSIKIDKIQYLPNNQIFTEEDLLIRGDLLLNTRNTLELVGKVAIWRSELPIAIYNSNLMRLKFDSSIVESNLFMNYTFNSYYILRQLRGIATGTTSVAAIYGRDLDLLKFLIPPLPEQKAIATVLSTWDEAIQKTEALILQKELRKKWLMQQLLTGKKRLKGFDGEWKEKKLDLFIKEHKEKPTNIDNFIVLTSAKFGLVKQSEYYGDNRITNRDNADYNVIPPNYLTYRSRSDDGLFTFNKNDLGFTGLVSGYYPVFTIETEDIGFILMYINYFRKKLSMFAIGTSQLVLTINELKKAKFKFPEQKEQTAISQVLQVADKEISLLKNKVDKLREQKKGLMQVLLTGKKRLCLNQNLQNRSELKN
ncbi:MAG: restriction endonuclease subunit S [Saprospiraceae bacterium]|nr:restriction endonuclease subunit S [Saprospiraceae bacterium]